MDSKPLSRNQHLVPTPFRSGSAKFTPEGHTQAVRNAKKFLHTKDSGSSWIYLAKTKSTSTNTVFCDFIKRCFQDSQASGCRCCKPYNNNKKKQQQIKKTEWDGGKSFPIAIFPTQNAEQGNSKCSSYISHFLHFSQWPPPTSLASQIPLFHCSPAHPLNPSCSREEFQSKHNPGWLSLAAKEAFWERL